VENLIPMLILASASATRKALLAGAGLIFETRAPAVDERVLEADALLKGADARSVALILAEAKARTIAAASPAEIVIGADQTLALGDDLLHKPEDRAAAKSQLESLRGKTHRLHAGIVLVRGSDLLWSHVETAELTLREFDADELDEVLALEGDAALSSVGGYRLEGPSIRLFERVAGDYFAILGLPLLALLAALRLYAPDVLKATP
jgi:septum formation protein